ncbi:hypothetical protein PUG81_25820 [Erwiniaceae bacterium L1_54_6]|nr:hypothetical protein [Erwiniaceae bacterium L1_54_6]
MSDAGGVIYQMKMSPVVILLILTVLASAAAVLFWLRGEGVKSELSQAKKDIDSSAAVIGNVQRTMTIFNQISAGRANEKEFDRQQGEKDRAELRASMAGNRCAAEYVPADAERRLREKADRIRARAVSAPSGGTLPGNAGA